MKTHPRVQVVVSSRPYGEGRPSHAEGFEELDVQPLGDTEIRALAEHFFECCYQRDERPAEESVAAFTDALARSEDAAVLARTALLLTMMLLISRSSPLPDKRHQLYQKCIDNLLTALPDRQESEGVAIGIQQWRPEDGEERFRVVAELAYEIQNTGYKEKTRGPIVKTGNELCNLLPRDWTEQQRRGFLAWLAERAGVLVDRADGTFTFTHLSFQEYLTARHLDVTFEGDEQRRSLSSSIEPERTRNGGRRYGSGGRLSRQSNPARLRPVFEALLGEEQKPGVLLAGCMFADGLGTDDTARRVGRAGS